MLADVPVRRLSNKVKVKSSMQQAKCHEFQNWFETLLPVNQVNCCVFPYSGSGVALFAPWRRQFGTGIGLFAAKLPGREDRMQEPPRTELLPLADDFAMAIADSALVEQPLVLAGFSMGALLAFEVARALSGKGIHVSVLFAGAARAPQGRWKRGKLHKLASDDDFIRQLNELYAAIPQAVIDDPEARQLLLPIIRADITLFETYQYLPSPPLDCELITLAGTEDPVVLPKHIAPWRQLAKRYRHRSFAGGHYFARSHREAVVDTLTRRIQRIRPQS